MIELVLDGTWQNLRTLSGFDSNVQFTLYNKSSDYVHITNTTLAPTDERDGFLVLPFTTINIEAGVDPVWVIGNGTIAVVETGKMTIGVLDLMYAADRV